MIAAYTSAKQFYTLLKPQTPSSTLLVFLHGLGSSQNFYYSIATTLSSQHNVLMLDHEGAAQSQLNRPRLSLDDLAINVITTIKELNLDNSNIILVGHSMSGMLVNYINIFHSDKLNIIKNILIGPVHPTPKLTQIFLDRIHSLTEKPSLIDFSNIIPNAATGDKCTPFKKAFIRQLIQSQTVEGYIANCHAIASGAEYDLDYSKNSKPTMIIYGKQDLTSPWTGCVEEIANKTPNKSLKELDVGHWIAIEDDEAVLKAIEEFI